MLDGLSKRRLYKCTKKHKNNVSYFFSNIDWKKILIICLAVILTGSLTVYATSSVNFVKNKIDLVKLFRSGKYLILFQNNAEARATGGFIGSFAVVDIEYGKIKNFYIDTNIYKRDHQYDYVLKRTAPEPLASWLKSIDCLYWSMRDANWAIDFPESAREISWFYKNEGGTNVDGIIAVNATVVEDLLKVIGPINLAKYNQVITSDNFFDTLHEEIEKKYFEDEQNVTINEPKTILKDLYTLIIERAEDKQYHKQILGLIFNQLDRKQILLYFNNPDLENLILSKNWGGKVIDTDKNYLHVNNSNLGGLKSSLNVVQNIKLDSFIHNTNDEVINKLTIVRSHLGDGEWPDNDNKNYMRILTPKGSKLVSAKMDGSDITAKINLGTEADKSVFGLWFTTPIGQTKILSIEYKLPYQLSNSNDYQLYLQKQPGSLDDEVEIIANDQVKFRGILDRDKEIE